MKTTRKLIIPIECFSDNINYDDAIFLLLKLYDLIDDELVKVIKNTSNILNQYIKFNFEDRESNIANWIIIISDDLIYEEVSKVLSNNNSKSIRLQLKNDKVFVLGKCKDYQYKIKNNDSRLIRDKDRNDYLIITTETPLVIRGMTHKNGLVIPRLGTILKNSLIFQKENYDNNIDVEYITREVNKFEVDRFRLLSKISSLKYKNKPPVIYGLQGKIKYLIPKDIDSNILKTIHELSISSDYQQAGAKNKYGFGKIKVTFGKIK